jgi:hypothetical protein
VCTIRLDKYLARDEEPTDEDGYNERFNEALGKVR